MANGMEGQDCYFFTLTRGRDEGIWLRRFNWHSLSTRLRQRWLDFAAFTVFEWSSQRGTHLHVVVRGAPELTYEWVQAVVLRLGEGSSVGGFEPVHNPQGLASYLAKQLVDPRIINGWPRNFRPVTFTRNWSLPPDVAARKEPRAGRQTGTNHSLRGVLP